MDSERQRANHAEAELEAAQSALTAVSHALEALRAEKATAATARVKGSPGRSSAETPTAAMATATYLRTRSSLSDGLAASFAYRERGCVVINILIVVVS